MLEVLSIASLIATGSSPFYESSNSRFIRCPVANVEDTSHPPPKIMLSNLVTKIMDAILSFTPLHGLKAELKKSEDSERGLFKACFCKIHAQVTLEDTFIAKRLAGVTSLTVSRKVIMTPSVK